MIRLIKLLPLATVIAGTLGAPAFASLTSFQTFSGNVAVSTDGWGSTSQSGVISANVPVGATVASAYLYTSTFGNGPLAGVGGTIAGQALTGLTSLGTNAGFLTAGRFNVTNILKPLIDGGLGGVYNFNVTETSGDQDGYALVVVYQLASLSVKTVGILDGFASVTGDTTTINFSQGIDKTDPNFSAEMRLGIGFSYDNNDCSGSGQTSVVTVNSTVVTRNAGCNDDSADASAANGNLITMGGDNDAFSALLPSTAADHERYNLAGQINNGDSSITVTNLNASNDDNIFLAVFEVSGFANFNQVPEPMSLALVGFALAGLGAQRRWTSRRA